MTIIYSLIIGFIVYLLAYLRANIVSKAFSDWNYYVYRYKNYCSVNYTEEEKPMCRVNANQLTRGEGILVFFMIWKTNPDFFFDFKPDWDDIYEMYLLKK